MYTKNISYISVCLDILMSLARILTIRYIYYSEFLRCTRKYPDMQIYCSYWKQWLCYICTSIVTSVMPSLNIESFCERIKTAGAVRLKMLFFCRKVLRCLILDFSKVRDVFLISTWLLLVKALGFFETSSKDATSQSSQPHYTNLAVYFPLALTVSSDNRERGISAFHSDVYEIFVLQGCYAAQIGS